MIFPQNFLIMFVIKKNVVNLILLVGTSKYVFKITLRQRVEQKIAIEIQEIKRTYACSKEKTK